MIVSSSRNPWWDASVALFSLSSLDTTHAASLCSKNEQTGNVCNDSEKKCGNWIKSPANRTNTTCTGCVCKTGFLRTVFGECVTKKDCDKCRQDHFESYQTCGTTCPQVCNRTLDPICYFTCVGGCYCIPGYIRTTPTGPCAPLEQCPPLCDNFNMEYSTCTSNCPARCNRTREAPCSPTCLNSGCQCKAGFVRGTTQYDVCFPESDCASSA